MFHVNNFEIYKRGNSMKWYELVVQIGIPLLSIITSIIVTYAKNKKVRQYANNVLSVTEKAKEFIIEAEKQTNYTGTEKKFFVMSRLLKYLFDMKIKSISEEMLSEIVENEVALTNEVNISKKNLHKNLSTNTNQNQKQQPQTLKV